MTERQNNRDGEMNGGNLVPVLLAETKLAVRPDDGGNQNSESEEPGSFLEDALCEQVRTVASKVIEIQIPEFEQGADNRNQTRNEGGAPKVRLLDYVLLTM